MKIADTPLRLLVKSYGNGLLTREQYLKIRVELLKKLSSKGVITQEDLENFLRIYQQEESSPPTKTSYSASDWVIIVLGFVAAAVMVMILYS